MNPRTYPLTIWPIQTFDCNNNNIRGASLHLYIWGTSTQTIHSWWHTYSSFWTLCDRLLFEPTPERFTWEPARRRPGAIPCEIRQSVWAEPLHSDVAFAGPIDAMTADSSPQLLLGARIAGLIGETWKLGGGTHMNVCMLPLPLTSMPPTASHSSNCLRNLQLDSEMWIWPETG